MHWICAHFRIRERKSSLKIEALGGLTTFAAMAYILMVNPLLLSDAGMPREALITVTAISAAFGCFLMAGLANLPIALAPGMGTNAYFTYVICLGMQVPWQAALALTFWNGLIFLILSVSGVRGRIVVAIPESVKIGITTGIGIFIAFIGLKNVGIIIADEATIVSVGNLVSPESILVVGGIVLSLALMQRGIPGAILFSIITVTLAGVFIRCNGETITSVPGRIFGMPAGIGDLFGAIDWLYPFREFSRQTVTIIATLFILDLFDTLGTLVAVARRGGLIKADGNFPEMGRALSADAAATMGGAILGTSTTTSYIESAAGVEAGARTGFASIITGICFLLALFATPLIVAVPTVATTPALVVVGILMLKGLKELDFDSIPIMAPALLTMILIPLTFSVTEGIGLGLILHVILLIFIGRGKEIPFITWFISVGFVVFFTLR
jgi:adenine/guanine/hypoxanthine permease